VHADFPLDAHARAIYASRASRCARDQDKYWEYHKDLLRNPTDFSDGDLHERAKRLGLDTTAFDACTASDRKDADIDAARRLGLSLEVDGTPSFYVNGRALAGARPYEELRDLVEEELANGGPPLSIR
jgi:protein-disulfide isomerase